MWTNIRAYPYGPIGPPGPTTPVGVEGATGPTGSIDLPDPSTPRPPVGCAHVPDDLLYATGQGAAVFLTPSGAIGMEYQERIAIHTIEQWIALSWHDLEATHPTEVIE